MNPTLCWEGKPLDELSREEMIASLTWAASQIHLYCEFTEHMVKTWTEIKQKAEADRRRLGSLTPPR